MHKASCVSRVTDTKETYDRKRGTIVSVLPNRQKEP